MRMKTQLHWLYLNDCFVVSPPYDIDNWLVKEGICSGVLYSWSQIAQKVHCLWYDEQHSYCI